ncbi:MAG: integrase [Nitrospirae bacterium CG_4_10_14_0_8_um_filter_41_23]|uniref:Integrase n=1 Tax=Candidatus Nealsonbacteria bacterium CG_4_10_14_0_2_um_filter_39_15 TaxID=1974681 RepID=A0A2M7UWD5_9BACT|nr:MAG: integrase [Nitrospirae bacterium CG_4_10_14_0_8_um_filter_41_23]PIZ88270.1 MAG: integrase [Candidatus Nealsonbacteria bacterium CG_4_10_14_0_2_um_filter_39_15]
MNTIMNDMGLNTIEQIKSFLEGVREVEFHVRSTEEKYAWIQGVLIKFKYATLKKPDKGIIFNYIRKMTGYSRQQLNRLVFQYKKKGHIIRQYLNKNKFPRKYIRSDIELLIKTDNAHSRLSGPATKKILEREYLVYGRREYQNIAKISFSHIYNLRARKEYHRKALFLAKTRPSPSNIGERAKPCPYGKPGYIRVDSVHQGDRDGQKGVYHINAVDEITQFEIVASVERINEACLIPVLRKLLQQFPFVIIEFHSDNGSEYINKLVAKLLNGLLIRLTKSRARQTNDNALVESKNGAVIRKLMGYAHIPQKYAEKINSFYFDFLNEYLNFHRPCFFPETITDSKGKQKKVYRYQNMMTPYEKLKSIPEADSFLKKGITFAILDTIAMKISDNQAAERMVKARSLLFDRIIKQA